MTKKEAMAFAISTGRPIAHTTFGADDCDASSTPLKDKLFNLLIWVRKNYGNR